MRLDTYETMNQPMRAYLSANGWHFSKKMAEWAISLMRDREGKPVKPKEISTLTELLKAHNLPTENLLGYDIVYVEAMARSDFFGSSLTTEALLIRFVSDYLGDKDAYEGMPLTRFYADTIGKGIPIPWEELI
ncbi:MAG: hypothetical protein NC346_02480 [Prevotella sp.]|nr:hypothetical protein [Bacteroidales bacterium]MCM1068740.1 hypothetical protein [Prevotella sp.]MCM1577161.1 hypothetical protein [Bacteroides sp.]